MVHQMSVNRRAGLGRGSVVSMDSSRLSQMIVADAYAAHLGLSLVPDPDAVVVEMTVGPQHLNFLGTTHGGAVFSLADCAFSLASNAAGDRAVAIDTHLVITGGSAQGDVLTARAEETTRGRTLGTYRITVTRGDGRVVGLFTGTVHISAG
jgi:phenylacetic acid degradation protein PaaD